MSSAEEPPRLRPCTDSIESGVLENSKQAIKQAIDGRLAAAADDSRYWSDQKGDWLYWTSCHVILPFCCRSYTMFLIEVACSIYSTRTASQAQHAESWAATNARNSLCMVAQK